MLKPVFWENKKNIILSYTELNQRVLTVKESYALKNLE